MMPLNYAVPGEETVIRRIGGSPEVRKHLEDLGFTPGQKLRCLHRAPFGDPAAYEVLGAAVALRKKDAAGIVLEETSCI